MEIQINQVYICDCGRIRIKEFDVRQGLICFKCGSVPKLSGQATLGVWTEVPFDVEVKSEDKDRVLDLLLSKKRSFIKSADIASILNFKTDKTQVKIRKIVLLLISEGFPIVSTGKGLDRRISQLQEIYNVMLEEEKNVG